MAETWPSTSRRRAILKVADALGRAAAKPFRLNRRVPSRDTIRRILVIEPWNIGDVVLCTPLLRALRSHCPDARISLLGKPHAQILLQRSSLVDEVIVCDLPWTASRHKYRLNFAAADRMRSLIRALQSREFDLTVDARMDIRSNVLATLTGAPHRIGFSIGGGGWLLTRSLDSSRQHTHKIDDWLDLLALLPGAEGLRRSASRAPHLCVSESERANARRRLEEQADLSAPVIGYHPGGSHAAKRWPSPLFARLIMDLHRSVGGSHVVFLGPDDVAPSDLPDEVIVRRTPLRELIAEIACCDVVVCNDSGPMHIADALGVPVVAIFEIGNPQWYGPSGARAKVVAGELAGLGISAAPVDKPPANPVSVDKVSAAVRSVLQTGSLSGSAGESTSS